MDILMAIKVRINGIVMTMNLLTQLFIYPLVCIGPGHAKTCLKSYANIKGADQPAHPCSLISTFVVRCLDL